LGGGRREALSTVFFVSGTPFWFMRTYLFLYLFAPVINQYLKSADIVRRAYLIISLGFMSHYVGTLGFDISLLEGKNLITFLFLYCTGNTLHEYRHKWMLIPAKYYGLSFILLNIMLIAFFSLIQNRIVDAIFMRGFFYYCSFGLLLNSLLFFMWIGGYRFHSKFINRIAGSSLTIYMIHGASLIFFHLIKSAALFLLDWSLNEITLFISIFLFTLLIVTCCVFIHLLLNPVWRGINKIGEWFQCKVNLYLSRAEASFM